MTYPPRRELGQVDRVAVEVGAEQVAVVIEVADRDPARTGADRLGLGAGEGAPPRPRAR